MEDDAVMDPQQQVYDVFVSYSHLDGQWVEETLLPRLQRADIHYCRDAEHFQGGGSSVANMERGIQQSERTLAVLTPEWVDSEWSQLEALMTIAHDPIGRRRRLVPLLLRKCQPSPAIHIVQLPATLPKSQRAEAEWHLLSSDNAESRAPLRDEKRVPGCQREAAAASSQMHALVDAIQNHGGVREEVVKYRAYFELVHRMVERLAFWKRLHDQLHNIERNCFRPLLNIRSRFPDEQTINELEGYKTDLTYALMHLQEVFDQDTVNKGPVPWHQALLTPAAKDLEEAPRARAFPPKSTRRRRRDGAWLAMHKLQRVLTMEPPTIDARLQSQAEAVPVKELLRALATLCDKLRGANIQSTKLLQFQQGAEGLFNLCQRLYWLRRDHHCWQEIDRELRFLESEDTDLPGEVIGAWEYLRALLALVETDTANRFIQEVSQDVAQLGAAIESKNAER